MSNTSRAVEVAATFVGGAIFLGGLGYFYQKGREAQMKNTRTKMPEITSNLVKYQIALAQKGNYGNITRNIPWVLMREQYITTLNAILAYNRRIPDKTLDTIYTLFINLQFILDKMAVRVIDQDAIRYVTNQCRWITNELN